MKINDVIKKIEKKYPQSLSIEYQKKTGFHDNFGLLCGDKDAEFKKMIVTLDLSFEAIDFAIKNKANLIFTHHPIIYFPIDRIDTDSLVGQLLVKCIQNNIAVYSSHLTQDISKPGTNYSLASELGFIAKPFKYDDIGCVFNYSKSLNDLVKHIEKKLDCKTIRYTGDDKAKIKKVLIIGGDLGSPSDEQIDNISKEVDAVITGESPYHTTRYLLNKNVSVIELTHQVSEEYFGKYVAKAMKDMGLNAIGHKSQRIYKNV